MNTAHCKTVWTRRNCHSKHKAFLIWPNLYTVQLVWWSQQAVLKSTGNREMFKISHITEQLANPDNKREGQGWILLLPSPPSRRLKRRQNQALGQSFTREGWDATVTGCKSGNFMEIQEKKIAPWRWSDMGRGCKNPFHRDIQTSAGLRSGPLAVGGKNRQAPEVLPKLR